MKLKQNRVLQAELGEKGITWHFIPARASHMGGVFERMIGLLKTELKKLSGGTKLTYQELKVHVLETQRILNNRPLIRAKASLDDLECISPMDLIRGYKDQGTELPEVYIEDHLEDLLEAKQNLPQLYIQKKTKREKFFQNLKEGYFESLRFRSAGNIQKKGQGQRHRLPKVGDVVIIKEDSPRSEWPLAIIIELLISTDGQIRTARIMKSNKKTTERIISDLYSLEIDAERFIPEYLDSRLQKDNNEEEKQESQETSRPQRQAALRGMQVTQDQYESGQV